MTASTQTRDFSGLHAAMQHTVDGELLAGVSSAVLHGRDLVDLHCAGFADRERGIKLGEDHLFRMFSSTKLVTSCAVLMLMEAGQLGLDDPIERFIPQLGHRQVLKPGATALDQTEPARSSITVRHLLCHSSGLGYGLLDPGTLLFQAFVDRNVRSSSTTLAEMIDILEG
ncbi:MAG: serine hydrolase, partial [Burkholderiales bacterium]|nr:serine hydrolase [Burkholderiales bacterium]